MTALTVTMEHRLQIHPGELRAMIEHRICDNRSRETLWRSHFRLRRRLHERGDSFYATGGR
jgi:hypothetical protein